MNIQCTVADRNSSNHGVDLDSTVIAEWHVTDLYRHKLVLAMNLRSKAKTKPTSIVRCNFRERAQLLEIDASDLAHCIAKFGDQKIATMDLERLKAEVHSLICNGSNPWLNGLDVIGEAIRNSTV